MELLTFVNPGAFDLGDAFDIPHDRRRELAKLLDGIIERQGTRRDVFFSEQAQKMQEFCQNHEELFWCWTAHFLWLLEQGRMKFIATKI